MTEAGLREAIGRWQAIMPVTDRRWEVLREYVRERGLHNVTVEDVITLALQTRRDGTQGGRHGN
jgi:hypothetical protein